MADEEPQRDEHETSDGGSEDSSSGQRTEEERLIPEEEIAEDGQVYVDREKIDFDPQEGLYSGTAVHGGTDIPGPHEQVDDIDPNEQSGGDTQDESADAGS